MSDRSLVLWAGALFSVGWAFAAVAPFATGIKRPRFSGSQFGGCPLGYRFQRGDRRVDFRCGSHRRHKMEETKDEQFQVPE